MSIYLNVALCQFPSFRVSNQWTALIKITHTFNIDVHNTKIWLWLPWFPTLHRQGPVFTLKIRFSAEHYNGVTVSAMASQFTSLATVYSTVYSGADQTKHQSSASPAPVRGNHRWAVNSPRKGPVTRKMFPFDDVIMSNGHIRGKLNGGIRLAFFPRIAVILWRTLLAAYFDHFAALKKCWKAMKKCPTGSWLQNSKVYFSPTKILFLRCSMGHEWNSPIKVI